MRSGFAWAIYMTAASLALVIAIGAYAFANNRTTGRELVELNTARQQDTNRFLELLCERLELRDEIVIQLLARSADAARERGDRVWAQVLDDYIAAFTDAQGDCVAELPPIRQPGS